VKEFLSQKKVAYKDFDVASDTAARQEMATKTGSMAVPTLIINGTTVVGFDRNKIQQLLQ